MGTDKSHEASGRSAGGAREATTRTDTRSPEDEHSEPVAGPRPAPSLKEEKPRDGSPRGSERPLKAVRAAKNNLRQLRLDRMLSKAELARRAGLSTLTIDRIERGLSCRMDTKRKILEALGLTPQDRVMVFGEDD